jgi:hypothetical protein
MERQWSDKASDPRIAPHLQKLADGSFDSLLHVARECGRLGERL